MKNTSRLIGALDLSKDFEYLEALGNDNNIEGIKQHTSRVLEKYNNYKDYLKAYGEKGVKDRRQVTTDEILQCLDEIHKAVENFDMDTCDSQMERLETFYLPESCKQHMDRLRICMADVAMEEIMSITVEMKELISKG